MTTTLEQNIVSLIATDRIYIPLSSMSGKIQRSRSKLAGAVYQELDGQTSYQTQRVYTTVTNEDQEKARTMREAIDDFAEQHPKYGKKLNAIIDEKRSTREAHLYVGTNEGRRMSREDYMQVTENLGLSTQTAQDLYPTLMDISRKLSAARGNPDRSIIVG